MLSVAVVSWQLFVLAVLASGGGYWLALALRRWVREWPGAWVWCGLAGFVVVVLLLQAFVYLDVPLRLSVWPVFAIAALGVIGCLWSGWRQRASFTRAQVSATTSLVGVLVAAVMLNSVSLVAIGPDQFIGKAQIDHVNYVSTAQFLVDEKFSTHWSEMGLRPWLTLPLEWKGRRISSCVAVGAVAVLSGRDAQHAWGATALFFIGLLGLALAAFWRDAVDVRASGAALLGLGGAVLPAVTHTYLFGYFAQLSTLFVFPALCGLLLAPRAPRVAAVVLAGILLGFQAASYVQFWPFGVWLVAVSVAFWPGTWECRAAAAAAIVGLSIAVTNGYVPGFFLALQTLQADTAGLAAGMSGLVPGGTAWSGWTRLFDFGSPAGSVIAVGVFLGLAAAVMLAAPARRWRWLLLFAFPLAVMAKMHLEQPLPLYPLHKLQLAFVPLVFTAALWGWWRLGAQLGAPVRWTGAALAVGLGAWAAGSAAVDHVSWVRTTRGPLLAALSRLFEVREEVHREAQATWLLTEPNHLLAAWLAYFARGAAVYCAVPSIADRRLPTETFPFRQIPPGREMRTLSLQPAQRVHPRGTVRARWEAVRRELTTFNRVTSVVGAESQLVLEDPAPTPMDAGRVVRVDFGVTPLPLAGPVIVEVRQGERLLTRVDLTRPTRFELPVQLEGARTVLTLRAQPHAGLMPAADEMLLVQALSIEVPVGP